MWQCIAKADGGSGSLDVQQQQQHHWGSSQHLQCIAASPVPANNAPGGVFCRLK